MTKKKYWAWAVAYLVGSFFPLTRFTGFFRKG
jgi:hypothetical protein